MQTQAQVNYRRGFAERQCGKCTMFRKTGGSTFGTCTDVTGQITPYGVCNILERLSNPFGPMPHAHRLARQHARLQHLIDNPY